MRVDMHAHYLPEALQQALRRRSVAPNIESRDGRDFIVYGHHSQVPLTAAFTDADLLLEQMDREGVDIAVLSVTIPGVDWLEPAEAAAVAEAANAETMALVGRYRGRIEGLAVVPLQSPEAAAAILESGVRARLKGAMIYSNVAGSPLDYLGRREFFDAAARLRVPVLLHPTYPLCAPTLAVYGLIEMAGFLFDTTTAALRIVFDGLYQQHPDFRFIVPHTGSLIPHFAGRIDHFGTARPGTAGAVPGLASQALKKLYVDSVSNWPPGLRTAVDFFGSDRVMLGSDYPFWPVPLAIETLEATDLSPHERADVEYRTAQRVFGLQAHVREPA